IGSRFLGVILLGKMQTSNECFPMILTLYCRRSGQRTASPCGRESDWIDIGHCLFRWVSPWDIAAGMTRSDQNHTEINSTTLTWPGTPRKAAAAYRTVP